VRTARLSRSVAVALLAAALAGVVACGSSGSGTSRAGTSSTAGTTSSGAVATTSGSKGSLTLLTYDAFEEPEALKTFTRDTGITVRIAKSGDAGTLVNKAILTAGKPEGDVLWGVDNTLLSRAVAAHLFVPYASTSLDRLDPAAAALVPGHEVTPVDTGDVCLNYDKRWFTDRTLAPPASLEDLTKTAYSGLTVVENPSTSSPGLAFLLATVARFGDQGYVDYWKALRANHVQVVDDWDTAYYNAFTAGGSGGKRPIVVSYSTSPPATIYYAKDPKPTQPTTGFVESSCFGQTEFAGILRGSKHEDASRRLVDFLVGLEFQNELPLTNFVYPVRTDATLPDLFVAYARPVPKPLSVSPNDIAAHRDQWIEQWTETVLR
jgi:thiamine transport system substrate-binding protein